MNWGTARFCESILRGVAVQHGLAAAEHRPRWLRADSLLGEHGIGQDTPAGRQDFERQGRSPVWQPRRFHSAFAKSPPTGDYFTMIRRHIEDSVRRAMTDTPVVLLNGARQTGKTTLAQSMATGASAQYFALEK